MMIDHGFYLAQWQGFEKGLGISLPTLLRRCKLFELSLEDLIGGIGRVTLEDHFMNVDQQQLPSCLAEASLLSLISQTSSQTSQRPEID